MLGRNTINLYCVLKINLNKYLLFFKELFLLVIVIFRTEVDWNGRMLDSCGRCGKAETHASDKKIGVLIPRCPVLTHA